VHAQPVDEKVGKRIAIADPQGDMVQRLSSHTPKSTHG
jgi:hypothetical protein